jgi:hypothetical protein
VVTDAQVRKMMSELEKHGNLSRAAMKADMDVTTARRYRNLGCVPTQTTGPRLWRTRSDPFEAHWPSIEALLERAPGLEAKALLEHLMEEHPGQYEPGSLRTLQRRLKQWRASSGPEKRAYLAQEHVPGEATQTDFTEGKSLGVTILGVLFVHLLCHVALPYSNWSWATVCFSESMSALKRGVQVALGELGGVTEWHQTDNSTAATHDVPSGKRAFNAAYLVLMNHLGMKPRTIAVGESEQNGDIESLNGALKRRLEQHLLLRGSRDFATVEAYEAWLGTVLRKTNVTRGTRLAEEKAVLRPLPARWLPIYTEMDAPVSTWSTIRVKENTYSVPSRLIGETVSVRIFDDRLEVWFARRLDLTVERLHGRNGHRVDYRHIIWSLVRRPGAFARYRYREDLFPTLTFRRTYDHLVGRLTERSADMAYLRILLLAASTMQSSVEAVLVELLEGGHAIDPDGVKAKVQPGANQTVPEVNVPPVELGDYDRLLVGVQA